MVGFRVEFSTSFRFCIVFILKHVIYLFIQKSKLSGEIDTVEEFLKVSAMDVEQTAVTGTVINRPYGAKDFLFLHFLSPVLMEIGGNSHLVNENSIIIFPPKYPHKFYAPDHEEFIHSWIHFTGDVYKLFAEIGLQFNKIYHINNKNLVVSGLKEINAEMKNRDINYILSIHGIMIHLFSRIARVIRRQFHESVHPCRKNTMELFSQIRTDIFRNPSRSFSLEDAARSANLSISRFCELYKLFFDSSPKKDFIDARISHAKYLITSSNLSISEISDELGYADIYSFIRQFKIKTGYSPGKYRN